MSIRVWILLSGVMPLAFGGTARANDETADSDEEGLEKGADVTLQGVSRIEDLDLWDLLDLETGVASLTMMGLRESPSLVTVITADEIAASGARDLVDVLALVPGIQFVTDTWNFVGFAIRGIHGVEGKVLVLLDGHELPETMYSTVPMGGRFPVEQIERVELIRGPGSVVYGEYAEMAVVKITTRSGGESRGGLAHGVVGSTAEGVSRYSGGGYVHQDLGASIYLTHSLRSDREYVDVYGSTWDMSKDSGLDAKTASLHLGSDQVRLDLHAEHYDTTHRDGYDYVVDQTQASNFRSYHGLFEAYLKLSDKATLTPRIQLKHERAWHSTLNVEPSDFDYYEPLAERATAGLHGTFDPSDTLNVIAGLEGMVDAAQVTDAMLQSSWDFDGNTSIVYYNGALYAQGILRLPKAPVIVIGARGDWHSKYGLSLVPRVAVTKAWDFAHFKAAYGRAFRPPGIENANYSPDLEPEAADTFEAEGGVRLGRISYLTASLFWFDLHDPVQY
ncbi:MAG: TonB-dependent receptor, partial [Deltaproteobacteria bacterium]|nr:TonB-dependent receptor [Deltaproteobacteria bacterium]